VISGAGPSLLALCTADRAQAVGRAMLLAWHKAGVESRTEVLNLQTEGSRWQPLQDR
jgi:homoserine kinase